MILHPRVASFPTNAFFLIRGCNSCYTRAVVTSNLSPDSDMPQKGAYILYLEVQQSLTLNIGILKRCLFPAGRYVYVGSALNGIEKRIARHRRIAHQKTGKLHWHIDRLLAHPAVRLTSKKALAGRRECEVSRRIATRRGAAVPVLHFGSTDCKAGCKAHLYRIDAGIGKEDRPVAPLRREHTRRIVYGQGY